jgi:isocitrate dehydrogenase kinase/phosphatase
VAKYHIVKTHDRVGRMADTQEFENLRFPKVRFAQDLLDELNAVCRSTIVDEGDYIVIRHLYTERQMIPLNLYIERCSESELRNVLDEYGNAVSQLAAANIFPGDMLFKNFGVTRHGRVVFYDYDEIEYLNRVTFRDGSAPERNEGGDQDVYPEDFRRFLPDKRHIRDIFAQLHPHLFTGEFWRALQRNVDRGEVSDVFPYRRKKRFVSQTVSHPNTGVGP